MTSIQPPNSNFTIVVVPSGALPDQTWANDLHATIIQAFKRKDINAFPESWTRLDPDPERGIRALAKELGPRGSMVVMLDAERTVACAGLVPFRGLGWVNEEKSATDPPSDSVLIEQRSIQDSTVVGVDTTKDWELCCFCVHPDRRRGGLSQRLLASIVKDVKQQGGEQLMANYTVIETGDYWPRMGFQPLPGGQSVLNKGFTHTAGMEGLREDLHFTMGVLELK